ncbi:MAG: hypothetical protein KME21_10410 [Desmonostoc vinosum HA7617-LM4]|nr:hypothetical protein [Desmonostoc vinosum HA7617-LM4]
MGSGEWLLWVGFLDFAFWLTRLRGDRGTRRKISERKNRFFQTEYEKPTLERVGSGEWGRRNFYVSIVSLDLLQKSDTRQKINFLADNLSRLKPTNNSIFSPFQRTFAIRQRLESLTVQVFLQEVYCLV